MSCEELTFCERNRTVHLYLQHFTIVLRPNTIMNLENFVYYTKHQDLPSLSKGICAYVVFNVSIVLELYFTPSFVEATKS
jgi:hypothetical protein